jgi:hypothetical protein
VKEGVVPDGQASAEEVVLDTRVLPGGAPTLVADLVDHEIAILREFRPVLENLNARKDDGFLRAYLVDFGRLRDVRATATEQQGRGESYEQCFHVTDCNLSNQLMAEYSLPEPLSIRFFLAFQGTSRHQIGAIVDDGKSTKRWLRTTAVRQMVAQKPVNVLGAQVPEGNALLLQPPSEVFGHLNATPNSRAGVPMNLQIRREALENYVKVAGGDPATDKCARDGLPSRGGTRKTLRFHRFRHHSPYPLLQPNTNSNSLRGISREAPFHNFHLCITALIESFP